MTLNLLDIVIFVIFFAIVIGISMFKSSKEENEEDFFLAGRGLIWPFIGISYLVSSRIKSFIFAALNGAVISSLASMLNSASTIFTMDIYNVYVKRNPQGKSLVTIGRIATVVFVLIACIIAPYLNDPRLQGIFTYIQEFQGIISPGVLAAFIFGLIVKKAPPIAGVVVLLLNLLIYTA